jgi:CDP-4-dehydro-6-deoxyglucose reductase
MSAQVHILPSGHKFFAEGNSTLLEAGLSAGLALGYGCSNGNCGKCLARVVSGEVEKTKHHDFHISEQQKARGNMLMCSNTAVTDVVMEATEANNASEIPQQKLNAKVRGVEIVNDDVALVHLKTPRTQRLRFLAGQRVELGGNELPAANHSVASCPCDDMHLHFQIPLLGDDPFSAYIFSELKKGDEVLVTGPGGEFVLNEDSPRSLVFIAWHTGFAPIRSLIEHAMALEVAENIHLVWITADKKDRYFDNLCRSWNDALDDFHYVAIDKPEHDTEININNIIFNDLKLYLNTLDDYDFYIAGTQLLLDNCQQTLLENGIPPSQIALDSITHE